MAVDFSSDLKIPEDFDLIEDFLPKLVKETNNELNSCNMSDIINIMDTYYALYEKKMFKSF